MCVCLVVLSAIINVSILYGMSVVPGLVGSGKERLSFWCTGVSRDFLTDSTNTSFFIKEAISKRRVN